jgi:hypothetical protein
MAKEIVSLHENTPIKEGRRPVESRETMGLLPMGALRGLPSFATIRVKGKSKSAE